MEVGNLFPSTSEVGDPVPANKDVGGSAFSPVGSVGGSVVSGGGSGSSGLRVATDTPDGFLPAVLPTSVPIGTGLDVSTPMHDATTPRSMPIGKLSKNDPGIRETKDSGILTTHNDSALPKSPRLHQDELCAEGSPLVQLSPATVGSAQNPGHFLPTPSPKPHPTSALGQTSGPATTPSAPLIVDPSPTSTIPLDADGVAHRILDVYTTHVYVTPLMALTQLTSFTHGPLMAAADALIDDMAANVGRWRDSNVWDFISTALYNSGVMVLAGI